MRRFCGFLLFATLLAMLVPAGALARGGRYVFDGGSQKQQAAVRSGLEASSFDWSLVPTQVTIHIEPGAATRSLPGHVWIDANLLDTGRFAWAVVQDEYAHQVDFFLFDPATRQRLNGLLGGLDWCYEVRGLAHSAHGCERFASTLVWSYWQSPHNSYRPSSRTDESAALPPRQFRALVSSLLAERIA